MLEDVTKSQRKVIAENVVVKKTNEKLESEIAEIRIQSANQEKMLNSIQDLLGDLQEGGRLDPKVSVKIEGKTKNNAFNVSNFESSQIPSHN